jgi:hypothetical protein
MGCGIGGELDSGKSTPFVLYARDGHAQGPNPWVFDQGSGCWNTSAPLIRVDGGPGFEPGLHRGKSSRPTVRPSPTLAESDGSMFPAKSLEHRTNPVSVLIIYK